MRFTADYDSEEEQFPVSDTPNKAGHDIALSFLDRFDLSSEDELDEDEDFFDVAIHQSPRTSHDAWLAMFNKEKEIGRLNVLNARSATKTFRNSVILEELEADSVADFLRQLSLDEENRRRTEEEELKRQNADVLDAISKLVSATKARAEEQRRKDEEAERLRLIKLEQERQKQEHERHEKERLRREKLLAVERARKAAEEEAAAAKREAEERLREQEKIVRKPTSPPPPPLPTTTVTPQSTSRPATADPAEAEFEAHLLKIESIKSNVLKPCSENATWKKACFELKRKITSRLGQLTNSRRQISRLVRDLMDTFEKGKSVHDNVFTWLLNFFSKQVIKQAESEVVVQIPSAYPLAFVCVFLMSKYPTLKDILLARFAKNSPWTVPFYAEPKTEESMKRMGYKRMEDGKWEETTRYIERQAGIFAVWTAMTTHKLPGKEAEGNPFPLSFAWRWAARTLNHQAGSEIECAMMATFLEVVNEEFISTYKKQGAKIVKLAVSSQWVGSLRGPAVGRLEIMGEEFQRNGRIGDEGFGAFVP